MTTWETRKRRKADLSRRIAEGRDDAGYCRIIGCTQRTPAARGTGLSRRACRAHEDHYGRHGSYTHGSFPSKALAPHRQAAEAWLAAHHADPAVMRGVLGVHGQYAAAGQHLPATRLAGLPPSERCRAAWARLRDAKVPPVDVLAAWLAVAATIASNPGAERHSEFRQVQAAKLLHRMASGTHRRWERSGPSGSLEVTELHKYPASRGRVLRHLGEQLERIAETVAAPFLDERTYTST